VPAGARQSPQDNVRNALLAPESPPRADAARPPCDAGGRGFESRRSRKRPCKSPCCVVGSDARFVPSTQVFRDAARKRRKTAGNPVPVAAFQADSSRLQTGRQGSVQLHETAGGQGLSNAGNSRFAIFTGQPTALIASSLPRSSEAIARVCRTGTSRSETVRSRINGEAKSRSVPGCESTVEADDRARHEIALGRVGHRQSNLRWGSEALAA